MALPPHPECFRSSQETHVLIAEDQSGIVPRVWLVWPQPQVQSGSRGQPRAGALLSRPQRSRGHVCWTPGQRPSGRLRGAGRKSRC